MAPNRPLVWPEQYALVAVTVIVLAVSVGLVVWALLV